MVRFKATLKPDPTGAGTFIEVPHELNDKKEMAMSITEAKKPETKDRRVADAIKKLRGWHD